MMTSRRVKKDVVRVAELIASCPRSDETECLKVSLISFKSYKECASKVPPSLVAGA